MNKKYLLWFVLLFPVLAVTVLAALLNEGYLRFNYPSMKKYPVQGIDISHHQGEINFSQINKEKVHFVFIKATEGGDFKDHKFKENWEKSRKHGFATGAYHFYTFCKSGREQALNFIESVPVEENSLPPAIDLEFGGNCGMSGTTSTDKIIAEIDTLQQLLRSHYGKTPVLYVTQEFYDAFIVSQFMDNPVWFRNIYRKPVMKDGREWTLWQFANRGHLDGINGFVDLNVFNGSEEEFEKLFLNAPDRK